MYKLYKHKKNKLKTKLIVEVKDVDEFKHLNTNKFSNTDKKF